MGARINGLQGETLETVAYSSTYGNSGDLEAATKTISAVAEPAVADYSAAVTLTAPTNARWTVHILCVRLTVTIDSFGGGGAILNYRLKRDGTSIGTGTLSTAASTGQKIISMDVTAGTLTGAATYTVFLWVDAGTCVVSECTITSAAGSMQPSALAPCLSFGPITGDVQMAGYFTRLGTGTFIVGIGTATPHSDQYALWYASGANYLSLAYSAPVGGTVPRILNNQRLYFTIRVPSVATDMPYVEKLALNLRRYVS